LGTPRRRDPGIIIAGTALVLVLLMFVFFCGTCFMFSLAFRGAQSRGDGVALIEVEGLISASSGSTGFFDWGVSSESLVDQLYRAQKDKRVKAVLLRINSPGGTPAASQEVYEEVRRTARAKPVVVSIGDVGASGAYLVASAADYIIAAPDSDVGSIGVIVEIPNISELNRKIGVDYTVITQGQYKDIGSPLRPVTPEEKAIITEQAKAAYEHFIKDVAAGRRIDEAKVRELATGITWPGTQARDLKLIDDTGNLRDAVEKAGRLGGIKGEVHLIRMESESPFSVFSRFVTAVRELARNVGLFRGGGGTSQEYPVKH